MIGSTLEGTHRGKPILIVQVYPTGGSPRCLVIGTDAKLHLIPMDEVSINWHYTEQDGWLPDFERPNS